MDDYDTLPYESIAFPETHPNHLSVLGRLLGLQTAPPERSRVLELGCAGGGNLIPMAGTLPGGRFLGIDLSTRQIEMGRGLIERVGLTNIELRQGDIRDLGEELGTFDYIIAHGVYSWIPQPVREHLLGLAPRLLAPTGLFYVSYNTLPGWRMRGMLRDILLYACRDADTPQARITAARGALERLQKSIHNLDALSTRYLSEEIGHLDRVHPSYLLFEYLAEHNQAFLFSEFAADAGRSGLRYLCDTDLRTLFPSSYGADVEQALEPIQDGLELEQWLDFVTNRNFRQSVLCRADTTLEEDIAIDLDIFAAQSLRADLHPARKPDLRRERDTAFLSPNGAKYQIAQPLTKAIVTQLSARYPDCLPLTELIPAAMRDVEAAGGGALASRIDDCLVELFSLFARGGIAAQPNALRFPPAALDRPRVSRLALAQIAGGATQVTTVHHGNLDLDSFATRLIRYLDGTRTPGDAAAALAGDLKNGDLEPPEGVHPRQWAHQRLVERVSKAVAELISLFARHGLLMPGDPDSSATNR